MKKEIKESISIDHYKTQIENLLSTLLNSPGNIIGNNRKIDSIEDLLDGVEDKFPELLQGLVFRVKDAIQQEAEDIWYQNNTWGLLAIATGTGKSRIPINILSKVFHNKKFISTLTNLKGSIILNKIDENDICLKQIINVLLIVPTEKLRDENWRDEFDKWDETLLYNTCVRRTCYASLDNIENQKFDLVIGDEWHNFTEAKMPFFKNNTIHRLICLTATPPNPDRDLVKIQLNKQLKIKTIYEVPIDIAVRLKLVAPYDVTVVECRLDDITKNVVGGTKNEPFMTTEKKAYDYKTQLVNQAMYLRSPKKGQIVKFRILDRMRFIKNLESLTKNTIFILDNFIREGERTLIFCGGIPQAERICRETFHSKTSDKYLKDFEQKKISRLSCVSALNEGMNIPDIETIIMVCPESGDKTITQQIGRGIRFALGHRCKVIIIIVTDTVSEKWFEKAIINLDQTKFRRVRFANLFNQVETI